MVGDPREKATAEALADTTSFRTFRKTALTRARQMDCPFKVETPHGTVEGKAGDYLCIDAMDAPYPCDKDTFETTHVEHTSDEP
jgi:hypothetical protein